MKSFIGILAANLFAAVCGYPQSLNNGIEKYITGKQLIPGGQEIACILVPGKLPETVRMPAAIPAPAAVLLDSIPAYTWSFGCSPTAAAMAAGHYDNCGYPDVYVGPQNSGQIPLDNTVWGMVTINGETRSQCPLSATMQGLDGRSIPGHVDDYWIVYWNYGPDPYIVNGWQQHQQEGCTGDFMGTNQSVFGNPDGSTRFFFLTNGEPLSDYTGNEPLRRDGCHGMRLFYESRGYPVVENYTQLIPGAYGNSAGFTFEDFKTEINNGRPVILQMTGHSMLGFGYDSATQQVYLHDTWDHNLHSMPWGGSYAGMAQWGVTVVRLASENQPPLADFTASSQYIPALQEVSFTDCSIFGPTNWNWTFPGGSPDNSYSQNPVVTYTVPGTYTVTLRVSNDYGYDIETRQGYITVGPLDYCQASAGGGYYISEVRMASIVNSSLAGDNGYSDYTLLNTVIRRGQVCPLLVKAGNVSDTVVHCSAWIDWNQDKQFGGDDEIYSLTACSANGLFSVLVVPPADAGAGSTRLRIRLGLPEMLVPCGSSMQGEIEDYTLYIDTAVICKTLQVKIFPEGLYNRQTGLLNAASGDITRLIPGYADLVDLKLASHVPPYDIVNGAGNIALGFDGTCIATLPSSFDSCYYIVIRHRNGIETWSSVPVSFSAVSITYDFTAYPAKAFGSNQKWIDGKACMYGSDVNQDGIVDAGDMICCDALIQGFVTGYLPEDVNGDGLVDSTDLIITEENSSSFVGQQRP